MPRILIVDDAAIIRDPMAAGLRVAGYQTETATNGKEGLAKARANRPDLILLDVSMPEMDGLTALEAIRADPVLKNVPVILLTARADRQTVVKAAQLGIRDYMLKSRFSMAQMLERVAKVLAKPDDRPPEKAVHPSAPNARAAAAEVPQLLTREQCLARVERSTSARPMSGVVGQVLSMAGSPLVEMSEMSALIGRDPLLSARVLRAANSAAFSGGRKIVSSISDAVRNVGLSAVRNIAAALSAYEAIPCGGADGFHYMRSWQHSFATAMICQKLAEIASPDESGAAYLVGLCHDLGQILFRSEFGKEYSQVLAIHVQTAQPLEELERCMLGTTQLDLARVILKKMSLPQTIQQPIEEFHMLKTQISRQRKADPTQAQSILARILHLAELEANGFLLAAFPSSEVGLLSKAECKAAVGREDPPHPNVEEVRGQTLALTPLLARLPEAEERLLCQPLLAGSGKRVCLVRDPAMSAFDPVAAALASLATVTVREAPPEESEQEQFDAVVVEARQRYPLKQTGLPMLRLAAETIGEEPSDIIEIGPAIQLEKLLEFLNSRPVPVRQAA